MVYWVPSPHIYLQHNYAPLCDLRLRDFFSKVNSSLDNKNPYNCHLVARKGRENPKLRNPMTFKPKAVFLSPGHWNGRCYREGRVQLYGGWERDITYMVVTMATANRRSGVKRAGIGDSLLAQHWRTGKDGERHISNCQCT